MERTSFRKKDNRKRISRERERERERYGYLAVTKINCSMGEAKNILTLTLVDELDPPKLHPSPNLGVLVIPKSLL